MSKLIDIAVKSKTAPKDTNCLWYDETVNRLKIFDSNGWRTISGGGEGSAGVSSINGVEGDILLKNIGGQSIIGGGNIEFPTVATTSKAGLVKPGNGLSVSPTGALNLNTASTNTFGGVKVDGVTIKINNGIISAEGASAAPIYGTYAEIKNLYQTDKLIDGGWYVITDYEATVDEYYRNRDEFPVSTPNNYKLEIVLHFINGTFSPDTIAIHPGDGGTFVEIFEIKYDFFNRAYTHRWADTNNGKGVIFYMKDRHNNELNYDFKNIGYNIDDRFFYTFSDGDGDDLSNRNYGVGNVKIVSTKDLPNIIFMWATDEMGIYNVNMTECENCIFSRPVSGITANWCYNLYVNADVSNCTFDSCYNVEIFTDDTHKNLTNVLIKDNNNLYINSNTSEVGIHNVSIIESLYNDDIGHDLIIPSEHKGTLIYGVTSSGTIGCRNLLDNGDILIPIIYDELYSLYENKELSVGAKYLITDYTPMVGNYEKYCVEYEDDYKIIVTATGPNTFSTDAELYDEYGYCTGYKIKYWFDVRNEEATYLFKWLESPFDLITLYMPSAPDFFEFKVQATRYSDGDKDNKYCWKLVGSEFFLIHTDNEIPSNGDRIYILDASDDEEDFEELLKVKDFCPAGMSSAKGTIYYMEDMFGNSAPYDFIIMRRFDEVTEDYIGAFVNPWQCSNCKIVYPFTEAGLDIPLVTIPMYWYNVTVYAFPGIPFADEFRYFPNFSDFKCNLWVGYDSSFKIKEVNIFDGGSGGELQIPITHQELWELKQHGQLIPGAQYRLIDYAARFDGMEDNTYHITSNTPPINIIVTALSNSDISSDAKTTTYVPLGSDGYIPGYSGGDENIKYNIDAYNLWNPTSRSIILAYPIEHSGKLDKVYEFFRDSSKDEGDEDAKAWVSCNGIIVYTATETPSRDDIVYYNGREYPIASYCNGYTGAITYLKDKYGNSANFDFKSLIYEDFHTNILYYSIGHYNPNTNYSNDESIEEYGPKDIVINSGSYDYVPYIIIDVWGGNGADFPNENITLNDCSHIKLQGYAFNLVFNSCNRIYLERNGGLDDSNFEVISDLTVTSTGNIKNLTVLKALFYDEDLELPESYEGVNKAISFLVSHGDTPIVNNTIQSAGPS